MRRSLVPSKRHRRAGRLRTWDSCSKGGIVRTEDPSPAPFAPLDWALGRKDDYLRRRESGGESKTGPWWVIRWEVGSKKKAQGRAKAVCAERNAGRGPRGSRAAPSTAE